MNCGCEPAAGDREMEHVTGKPTQAFELAGPEGESAVHWVAITSVIIIAVGNDMDTLVKIAAALHEYAQTESQGQTEGQP
jgi:hypothetical protein